MTRIGAMHSRCGWEIDRRRPCQETILPYRFPANETSFYYETRAQRQAETRTSRYSQTLSWTLLFLSVSVLSDLWRPVWFHLEVILIIRFALSYRGHLFFVVVIVRHSHLTRWSGVFRCFQAFVFNTPFIQLHHVFKSIFVLWKLSLY